MGRGSCELTFKQVKKLDWTQRRRKTPFHSLKDRTEGERGAAF